MTGMKVFQNAWKDYEYSILKYIFKSLWTRFLFFFFIMATYTVIDQSEIGKDNKPDILFDKRKHPSIF